MRGRHDIGPRKGTVTGADGKPADMLSPTAAYPLEAECWTCGGLVRLRSAFGQWLHLGSESVPEATGATEQGQAPSRPGQVPSVSP